VHAIPPGKKVLVLIDQFEQWIIDQYHYIDRWLMSDNEECPKLLEALGYCDGGRIQVLLVVRQDFEPLINHILPPLGLRVEHYLNLRRMPILPKPHAKKVLAAIGQAYGILDDDILPRQQTFLTQAVEGLSQDGLVTPIRLVIFAERLRSGEWTPNSIKRVG